MTESELQHTRTAIRNVCGEMATAHITVDSCLLGQVHPDRVVEAVNNAAERMATLVEYVDACAHHD